MKINITGLSKNEDDTLSLRFEVNDDSGEESLPLGGATLQFPKGTSKEKIKAEIKKQATKIQTKSNEAKKLREELNSELENL